jgi:transposase-like protein
MPRRTALGDRLLRCPACRRTRNERPGTPFTHRQGPPDVVLRAVLGRRSAKLRLRDVAELLRMRGGTGTHATVRAWEERFAPLLSARLQARRRGTAGCVGPGEETDVSVNGRWCSL